MVIQLGKLSIGLVARDGIALKGLGGESLHGLFYRILKNHSPELASEIHAQDGLKPFSLGLISPRKPVAGRHPVKQGLKLDERLSKF